MLKDENIGQLKLKHMPLRESGFVWDSLEINIV